MEGADCLFTSSRERDIFHLKDRTRQVRVKASLNNLEKGTRTLATLVLSILCTLVPGSSRAIISC